MFLNCFISLTVLDVWCSKHIFAGPVKIKRLFSLILFASPSMVSRPVSCLLDITIATHHYLKQPYLEKHPNSFELTTHFKSLLAVQAAMQKYFQLLIPKYTPKPAARLQDQDTPKKRSSPRDPREAETLAALCILVSMKTEKDRLLVQNWQWLNPTQELELVRAVPL